MESVSFVSWRSCSTATVWPALESIHFTEICDSLDSEGDSGSSKNIVLATLPWATGIEKLSGGKQQVADPSHMIQGGDPWAVASAVTGLRYDVAIGYK